MPIRSLPVAAPVTPTGPRHRVRAHVTRAAVVATTSAAAAVFALLPVDGPTTPTAAPTAALTTAPTAAAPVVTTPVAPVAARSSVVELALGKVGARYRWGATGPSSFDCSGLVSWAFDQVGVDVPRTSRALSRAGSPVSRGNLQPGDLVFFYSPVSHVGIYIGDGKMVHASTSGKPVAVASIDGRPYHSARRI